MDFLEELLIINNLYILNQIADEKELKDEGDINRINLESYYKLWVL